MRNRTHTYHMDILGKAVFMGLLLLFTLLFILPGMAVQGNSDVSALPLTVASMTDPTDDAMDDSTEDSMDETIETPAVPLAPPVFDTAEFTVGSMTYMKNGVMSTMDVAPFIEAGRSFVPLRYLALSLGVAENDIQWNGATQEVTLRKGETNLMLTMGSPILRVNGNMMPPMEVMPVNRNDRIFLPARYVAEAIGYTVGWNEMAQKVTLTSTMPSTPPMAPAEATEHTVDIEGFAYIPETLTIKVGDSVTWTNRDNVEHTVTFDNGEDSGLFGLDETYTLKFEEAGTFDYTCTPHPQMEGTVIVE